MSGRLLFLNPPGPRFLYRGTVCTYLSKARYVWKPKDFILASARVPANWDLRFIDAAIRRMDAESTLAQAHEIAPSRVLMAMSSISWRSDLDFLYRLRRALPGAHLTLFGEVLLEPGYAEQVKGISDAILYNPIQYDVTSDAFPVLPDRAAKGGTEADLGIPRHALFDHWRYRWPFNRHFRYAAVYTQYGCPYSCSYCTESITSVFYRPAEKVLEELTLLKRQGYKELHLGDASFGFPKANAQRLLEGMASANFGFSWSCYTYPGLVDREMLTLMKRTGCHTLVIGIDSADFDMLRRYGRRLSRERLDRFLADCRELDLDVCGDFILGFDEEDEASIRKTVDLALSSGLAYTSFNVATPLFGSSIRKRAQEEHRLAAQAEGFDTAGNAILGNPLLKPESIRSLRRDANRSFYLRPSYLWRRLSRIRGPQHLAIQGLEALGLAENYFRHLAGDNASPRPGD